MRHLRLVIPESEHETRMAAVLAAFNSAPTKRLKQDYWNQYAALHQQRDPATVAAMERARGLCRG